MSLAKANEWNSGFEAITYSIKRHLKQPRTHQESKEKIKISEKTRKGA